MAKPGSRYRREAGTLCVDVKVGTVEQLFDNRDPAPFRVRDLDPGVAGYLRDGCEDLVGQAFRVVFWVDKPCQPAEVEAAYRGHFDDALERLLRDRRRRRRTGQITLVLAVLLLVVMLSLSEVVARVLSGSLGAVIREGLVILSWVVMWRPVEVLIYDWIPVRRERTLIARLLAAPVDVRIGVPPASAL